MRQRIDRFDTLLHLWVGREIMDAGPVLVIIKRIEILKKLRRSRHIAIVTIESLKGCSVCGALAVLGVTG